MKKRAYVPRDCLYHTFTSLLMVDDIKMNEVEDNLHGVNIIIDHPKQVIYVVTKWIEPRVDWMIYYLLPS